MTITVKLFAQYREGRFKEEQRTYPEGTYAKEVVAELGIYEGKFPLGVLMLNGRHQPEEVELHEGDVLSLFPKVGGG
ncbi:MAG: MoaD/ThiS family protein [Campylobacterales bacterium]|nr:MoaD/ThiS family protein [Campylobacterales bacterium]